MRSVFSVFILIRKLILGTLNFLFALSLQTSHLTLYLYICTNVCTRVSVALYLCMHCLLCLAMSFVCLSFIATCWRSYCRSGRCCQNLKFTNLHSNEAVWICESGLVEIHFSARRGFCHLLSCHILRRLHFAPGSRGHCCQTAVIIFNFIPPELYAHLSGRSPGYGPRSLCRTHTCTHTHIYICTYAHS